MGENTQNNKDNKNIDNNIEKETDNKLGIKDEDEVAKIIEKYSKDTDIPHVPEKKSKNKVNSGDKNSGDKSRGDKNRGDKISSIPEKKIPEKIRLKKDKNGTLKSERDSKSAQMDDTENASKDLSPEELNNSKDNFKNNLKESKEKSKKNTRKIRSKKSDKKSDKKSEKKSDKKSDDPSNEILDELIELEKEAQSEIKEIEGSGSRNITDSDITDSDINNSDVEIDESLKKKIKRNKILIGLTAAALIVVILIGILNFNSKKKGSKLGTASQSDASASTASDADAEDEELEKGAPKVKLSDKGNNYYVFSWKNENAAQFIVYTKGYSLLDPDMAEKVGLNEWTEVTRINCSDPKEEMSYTTGRLEPYQHLSYKIVAVYGDEELDSKVFEFDTSGSSLYATIWTTMETTLFKSADKDEQIGVVPANTTLSVLDEKSGRFLVSTDSGEGYIDSRYCLINLPEYLGGICRYDITDSYDSIINVQGYAIPEVTGKVIPGYENVLMKDGTFVVPLLYPSAKKMAKAAEFALADGYMFKIYDAYRPYISTEYVYDTYKDCVDYYVPEEKFTRITVDDYLNEKYATVLNVSELTKYEPTEATEGDAEKKSEEGSESEKPTYDPSITTYANMMLGGGYESETFIDDSASRHNLGVAVDVTLETLVDGTELSAQTGIFDLSYKSVQAYNNENVVRMKGYMESAGFNMIASEWWHFQDNSTTTSLRPNTLNDGVSIEGWKKDDVGWFYRLADGSWYADETQNINGIDYKFDENGYLVSD